MAPEPKAGTTDDAFMGGRLNIMQPADGFRSGIDAVLLAASVDAAPGESVLDVGTGAGVAALCLAARLPEVSVTGIDVQADLCRLAATNAERNGLAARVAIAEADVRDPVRSGDPRRHAFDHVMANPPYHEEGRARAAADPGRARANMLAPDELDRWIRFMVTMARSGGTVTLVHRADALPVILNLLERRAGAVAARPIHPRAGEEANRVIVSGRTGSRAPFRLLPALVLHGGGSAFTEAADRVLRHGAGLNASLAA